MGINIQAKTDYSSLFTGMNNSGNSNALTDLSWLSDYSSIKSGTYGRLMKAYYAEESSDEVSKVASSVKKLETVSDETKLYNKTATSADSVQSSIKSLDKLAKDADDDTTYAAVNSFVKDYNSVLENAQATSDTSIANRLNSIKGYTAENKADLAKIGITANSDGTLKLDKDTLAAASREDIGKLFAGRGSYGYSVSTSAAMIQSSASYDAARTSTYTNTGSYSNVTGSLWDSTT